MDTDTHVNKLMSLKVVSAKTLRMGQGHKENTKDGMVAHLGHQAGPYQQVVSRIES